MSAEANKERKLRARSDQVHQTSFVLCLKIKDILGMREKMFAMEGSTISLQ